VTIQAGDGAKKFTDYTVTKAIYATAWDGDIVLEADSMGRWKKISEAIVPEVVNINTASSAELESLPGLSPKRASAIVAYRQHNARFTKPEDLDAVPGIGPATINLIRPYIRF
jgi:competence protein ComEA